MHSSPALAAGPPSAALEHAVPWSPLPAAFNLQAFLEVVCQERAWPSGDLTLIVASRTLAGFGPLQRAAWRLLFRGVATALVEPASAVPSVPKPVPVGVPAATWKVDPSRAVAALAAGRLPGFNETRYEHFVVCTLSNSRYHLLATACESTLLSGAEAEVALAAYEQRVDAVLAARKGR